MGAIPVKKWDGKSVGVEFKGVFFECPPLDIEVIRTVAGVLFGMTDSQADDVACAKYALERAEGYVNQMKREVHAHGPKGKR